MKMNMQTKNILKCLYISIFFLVSANFSEANHCYEAELYVSADKFIQPQEWYKFLGSLHLLLTSHEIQKNTSQFNFIDFKKQKNENKLESIEKINSKNFDKFLKLCENYNISKISKNKTITKWQLDELNNILEITLRKKVSIECTEKDVMVTGNFISFKNFINSGAPCDQKTLEKISGIKIFAYDTIFLDFNYSQKSFLNYEDRILPLILVAPKLEIVGNDVRIYLDGIDGKNGYQVLHEKPINVTTPEKPVTKMLRNQYEIDVVIKYEKAEDGSNGVRGMDGHPGGFFLGICNEIVGGYLLVSVNGGNGGNGLQGENGKNGHYVDKISNEICLETHWYSRPDVQLVPSLQECEDLYKSGKKYKLCWFPLSYKWMKRGGNGGDGAAAGIGGLRGNMYLHEFHQSDKEVYKRVRKRDMYGKTGKDGARGIGGYGESGAHEIKIRCLKAYDGSVTELQEYKYIRNETEIDNSLRGRDGVIEPRAPSSYSFRVITPDPMQDIAKQYKRFFRLNSGISLHEFYHLDFYENLNKFPDEFSSRPLTVNDLIDELTDLYKESYEIKLNEKRDYYWFFQLLMDRIEKYSNEKMKEPIKNTSESDLLLYLYTSALTRQNNMKEILVTAPINDVPGYLKSLESRFDGLKKSFTNKNILQAIYFLTKQFKEDLNEEINSVKSTIDTEIKFEIEEITRKINSSMKLLHVQITQAKKSSREKYDVLLQSQSNLKCQLYSKSILQLLQTSSAAIALLGPYGAVASAVFEVPLQIGKAHIESNANNQKAQVEAIATKLKQTASSMKAQAKAIKEMEAENLKKILDEVSERAKSEKKLSKPFEKFLNQKKKQLATNELDPNKLKYKDIVSLRKEISNKFKSEKEDLKIKQKTSGVSYEKLIYYLDKHEKFTSVVPDAVVNIYFAYKEFSAERDHIDELIEGNLHEFKVLEEFENDVYPVLLTDLNDLAERVDNIEKNIDTKSEIDFNLLKYKQQNIFANMKKTLNQLFANENDIKGDVKDIKNDLIDVIEKLDRLLNLLTLANNKIQHYRHLQKTAQLMGTVNMAHISVSNNTEHEILKRSLHFSMMSNILLNEYQIAFQALEQYIFPFSDDYLRDFKELPESLRVKGDINNVVDTIVDKLKIINSHIERYEQSMAGQYKENVLFSTFSSRKKGAKPPFFVWKNSDYKSILLDLLSGKKVLLNADIRKSKFSYEVIKFNEIRVYFRSINPADQKKLDDILESFEIRLTHFGDSHYKYKNKTYLIVTNKIHLGSSFVKDEDSDNPASLQLKKGSYVFSPYALWKAQLFVDENKSGSFEDLKPFKGKIDLELEGHGSHLYASSNQRKRPSYPKEHRYEYIEACDDA